MKNFLAFAIAILLAAGCKNQADEKGRWLVTGISMASIPDPAKQADLQASIRKQVMIFEFKDNHIFEATSQAMPVVAGSYVRKGQILEMTDAGSHTTEKMEIIFLTATQMKVKTVVDGDEMTMTLTIQPTKE